MAPISKDDPSMAALITAFQDANTTTTAVRSNVTGAVGALQFTGESADTYRNSIGQWLDGLTKVETGLAHLDNAMKAHNVRTNATHDDAISKAAKWHQG